MGSAHQITSSQSPDHRLRCQPLSIVSDEIDVKQKRWH